MRKSVRFSLTALYFARGGRLCSLCRSVVAPFDEYAEGIDPGFTLVGAANRSNSTRILDRNEANASGIFREL